MELVDGWIGERDLRATDGASAGTLDPEPFERDSIVLNHRE
jgi:hypothetical protein